MKYFLSLLFSILIFFVFASMGVMKLQSDSGGLILPEESGAVSVWLAQNLEDHNTPSIEGSIPVSMTNDSLYVGLLRLCLVADIDPSSLLVLLGVLFMVATFFYIHRYAVLLGLGPLEVGMIMVATVLLPGSIPVAISGTSGALFTLLITLGVISYFKSQHNQGYGFSIKTLFPFALAAALHVEVLILVLVLGVGNIVCGLINKEKKPNTAAVVFDLFASILLAGIFLLPAVAYHMNMINVPWPRSPDAWLALGSAGAEGVRLPQEFYSESLKSAIRSLGVMSLWPGPVFWLGLMAAILLTIRRQSVTSIHFMVMIFLAPALAAAMVFGVGFQGLAPLMQGLQPILFLLACFVICRGIPLLLSEPEKVLPVLGRVKVVSLGLAGLLLIGMVIGAVHLNAQFKASGETVSSNRQWLDELVQASGPIGSDRAGWVALYTSNQPVDVTGRTDLSTLALIGPRTHLDSDGWRQMAQERSISGWFLTEEATHESLLDSGVIERSDESVPVFYSSRFP